MFEHHFRNAEISDFVRRTARELEMRVVELQSQHAARGEPTSSDALRQAELSAASDRRGNGRIESLHGLRNPPK
jgi:hypothetical protein